MSDIINDFINMIDNVGAGVEDLYFEVSDIESCQKEIEGFDIVLQ